MMRDFVLTSESVTDGHPDKLCDRISDAVVDRLLLDDPWASVDAECAMASGTVFVAVRHASCASIDVAAIAREVIALAGYTGAGFNADDCSILLQLATEKPPDPDDREPGEAVFARVAADNLVTLFGFACRQSPTFLPLPIWLAHRLARRIAALRAEGVLAWLEPEAKTQVGVTYVNRRPARIDSLTLICALDRARAPAPVEVASVLHEFVVAPVFAAEPVQPDQTTRIFVNPAGSVLDGGPMRHAGLTGRKTGIDTYGEYARHGGAALSGKDPARIDRAGAYAARHAAKSIVTAGLADECEVQLSYTLGLAEPVSVEVDTFGTGAVPDSDLGHRLRTVLDFRPAAIVARFGLRNLPAKRGGSFYRDLAAYGQMGRVDLGAPWEDTAGAEQLLTRASRRRD